MIVAMWTYTAATRSDRDVRFIPDNGHGDQWLARQLRAKGGHGASCNCDAAFALKADIGASYLGVTASNCVAGIYFL